MSMQCCFINTENIPLKTKVLGYTTNIVNGEICLVEFVEETYPHPDAPDSSTVSIIRMRPSTVAKVDSQRGAALYLLNRAEENVRLIKSAFMI